MSKDETKTSSKLLSKWWFWAIVLGILVGGATTLGIMLSKNPQITQDPTYSQNTTNGLSAQHEEKEYPLLELVNINGMSVIVSYVSRNYNVYDNPAYGKEFVYISLGVANNTGKKATYNTFDWKVETSSGALLNPSSISYRSPSALKSGELVDGGTISGSLIFEVPKDDSIKIRYSNPNDLSDEDVIIVP